MKSYRGFYWPDNDVHAHPVIMRDAADGIEWALSYTPGRQCVVQAGACVGVYPLLLAEHFERVVTFEPDGANYDCLTMNLHAATAGNCPEPGRIDVRRAALGAADGYAKVIVVEEGNCGAHRVGQSDSGVRVLTIDSLKLKACDLLFLDVEGQELPALRGAIETIEHFSPVIVVEMKGLGEIYGHRDIELHDFLAELGYIQVSAFGNDRLYRKGDH